MKRSRVFVFLISGLVLMPIVAIGALALMGSFRVTNLRIFGEIPKFELTERSGEKVTSESLKGKVWVASFVFTHCAGQCPLLCQKLKKVQSRLRFKENFRLVSISVDPERDTTSELRAYADRFQADPYKWLFLTGQKNEIQQLVQHGFRLASMDTESAGGDILHSFKLVLVDGGGRIRGYYDGLEDEGIKSVLRDAKQLIRQTF